MRRPRHALTALVAGLGVAALLAACGPPPRQGVAPPVPQARMIRVGTSADAPPITFLQDGRIAGVEPDLAQAMVNSFGRPVALIPLEFDELVPALLDGRIDVIMSGMSITRAREVRIAFSDPYLRSGLLAATSRAQAGRYATRDAILNSGANIGVRMGSTAESWAQSNLRSGSVVPYPRIEDAARELSQGRLDLIVSDAPQTAWAVSSFAATLQILPMRLTQEDIAWAFRPEDVRLRQAANTALAAMRRDGRLRAILLRWIPFLDRLERLR